MYCMSVPAKSYASQGALLPLQLLLQLLNVLISPDHRREESCVISINTSGDERTVDELQIASSSVVYGRKLELVHAVELRKMDLDVHHDTSSDGAERASSRRGVAADDIHGGVEGSGGRIGCTSTTTRRPGLDELPVNRRAGERHG